MSIDWRYIRNELRERKDAQELTDDEQSMLDEANAATGARGAVDVSVRAGAGRCKRPGERSGDPIGLGEIDALAQGRRRSVVRTTRVLDMNDAPVS